MLRCFWCFLCGVVIILACPSAKADDPRQSLAERINSIIQGPNYRHARWGILTVDSDTGKTVFEHNPDQLFLPASTTKLYSCSAALGILGADYRFETPICVEGNVELGRLRGNLILVAKGDLTLGGRTDAKGKMAFHDHDHTYANFLPDGGLTDTDPLAGLKSLAKQVRESGITRVDGDVLVDDRLFDHDQGSGSGPSLLTPIVVNDNVVDVLITPGAAVGEAATVKLRPVTEFLQLDAKVETVEEGKKPAVTIEMKGPQRLRVRGKIACKAKPFLRIVPMEDPTRFARVLLIEALREAGVAVANNLFDVPRTKLPDPAAYDKLTRVALFTSPPLSETIKVTLKVSHNLYASTLPLLTAVHKRKKTLADGLHLQRGFLVDLGVDADAVSFAGGAGGANADAVTPRASVQLLRALAKRTDYPVLEAALPIMGVDGTLADAVPDDSPIRGKVLAKTGTLLWHDVMNERKLLRSKALAGTMTTKSGRPLTVAMYVNDVFMPMDETPTREGKVLGRLCEILFQDGQ